MDFRGIRKTVTGLNLDDPRALGPSHSQLNGSYGCFENTIASFNQLQLKVEYRKHQVNSKTEFIEKLNKRLNFESYPKSIPFRWDSG